MCAWVAFVAAVLRPCPACRTHLRHPVTETRCPFCDHPLSAVPSAPRPVGAANAMNAPTVQAVAAALLGLGLAACDADTLSLEGGNDNERPADAGRFDATSPSTDSGPAPDIGAPAVDSGAADSGDPPSGDSGLSPTDSGLADAGEPVAEDGAVIIPLYGQPPPLFDASVPATDAGEVTLDGELVPTPLYGVAPPPRDAGVDPDAMS